MKKLELLFHQFSTGQAVIQFLLLLVRKLFNMFSYSYSQFGEDNFLLNYFHFKTNGFYVEVGSHHPIKISNSFNLYLNGWKGICIDANSDLIMLHKKIRKNDIAVNALISTSPGEIDYFEFDSSAYNSSDTDFVKKVSSSGVKVTGVKKIPSKKLDQVLDESGISSQQEIDVLMIDVEGLDFEVLRTLNLEIFRPKLIVIEVHDFDIYHFSDHEIIQYLHHYNYKLIGFLGFNLFLERKD